MAEPVEALLFDFGGVTTEIDFGRVVRRWSELAGRDLEPLWRAYKPGDVYWRHERGLASDEEFFGSLRETFDVQLSDAQFLDGWNSIFVGLYPQIEAQLEAAAAKLPIYAFTNTNTAHERYWSVAYKGMISRFRKIYVSSTIGMRKPDVEAFSYVANDMGVKPSRILFFDDSAANIAGAQVAGMQTVHVKDNRDLVAALSTLGVWAA